jgi:hypothetical protein
MAQHDYVIANASGATVRADINNMALAISSNNSGSSAPSTTYAYLWWIDTSNNLLKLRNSANNAWITMPFSVTANNTVDINGGAIDGTPIGASSANTGAFTTLTATTFTSTGIDDNADATAITINSSEQVGIGTTSPSVPLDVAGIIQATGYLAVEGTSGNTGSAGDRWIGGDGTAGSWFYNVPTGSSHLFGVNNSNQFVITGSGVGIGTTSPTGNLHVAGSGSTVPIKIDNTGTGGDTWRIWSTNDAASDGGGKLGFYNEDTATRAMTLDSSGKVGIGTTSPETLVHIKAADTVTGVLKIEGGKNTVTSNGEINAQLDFGSNDASVNNTGNVAGRIASVTSENNGSSVDMTFSTFLQSDSPPLSEKMRITDNGKMGIGLTNPNDYYSFATDLVIGGSSNRGMTIVSDTTSQGSIYWADGTSGDSQYRGYLIYDHSLDAMRLGTAGTERMRITSAGQLLVGATSSPAASYLFGYNDTNSCFVRTQNNSTSSYNPFAIFHANSTSQIGSINCTNTATVYNTSSDYRLKENIQPLENGLERLNTLKPVKFDWKNEDTSSEGFIAHEVQEIFSDAVTGEKDGEDMQGMDYGRITPLLVKAIQEQQEQIEQLKAEVQTLKENK